MLSKKLFSLIFLTSALTALNAHSSDVGSIAIDFKNPSVRCDQVKEEKFVFSPGGLINKITETKDKIYINYGIIDGGCSEGKYIPKTGGVLLYREKRLSTNLGLFSGIKTKDLVEAYEDMSRVMGGETLPADSVEVRDDGTIILAHKGNTLNTVCYDTGADQFFWGNKKCNLDRNGSERNGKFVSFHEFNFQINKAVLLKALEKNKSITINYQIVTNKTVQYDQTTNHVINMRINVKKDENNKLLFLF